MSVMHLESTLLMLGDQNPAVGEGCRWPLGGCCCPLRAMKPRPAPPHHINPDSLGAKEQLGLSLAVLAVVRNREIWLK